jgi:hypothetical protein
VGVFEPPISIKGRYGVTQDNRWVNANAMNAADVTAAEGARFIMHGLD